MKVQMPLIQWKKVVTKFVKYEQDLQRKEDLEGSFAEVETLKKTNSRKKTLSPVTDEL